MLMSSLVNYSIPFLVYYKSIVFVATMYSYIGQSYGFNLSTLDKNQLTLSNMNYVVVTRRSS